MSEKLQQKCKAIDSYIFEKKWNFWKYFWILMLVSIVLRFLIADFPRLISIYADEFEYYLVADSYAHGRGFTLFGLQRGTADVRFIYSFILSLAFHAESTKTRLQIIALLNSIMMNLSAIPMALLIREMVTERRNQLLLVLACFLFPDLAFTITFMTENLFYPLALLVMYCSYLTLEYPIKSKKFWIGVAGFLAGIVTAYYVKSTTLVLATGYFFYLFLCVIAWSIKRIQDRFGKALSLALGGIVLVAISVALYIFYTKPFPGVIGRAQGYYQSAIWGFLGKDYALMGREYLKLWLSFLVAIGFTPLLYFFLFQKGTDAKIKKYFYFIFTLIFISITYIGHFSLNAGEVELAIHFRYICYVWLPLIITFTAFIEQKLVLMEQKPPFIEQKTPPMEPKKLEKSKADIVKAVVILGIIASSLFLFHGSQWTGASAVDQTVLAFVSDKLSVTWPFYALIMLIANAYLSWLFFRKDRRTIQVYLCLFLALCLLNDVVVSVFYRKLYGFPAAYDEDIADFIREHPESNFIVIDNQSSGDRLADDIGEKTSRWSDMHLNLPNVYKTSMGKILEGVDLTTQQLPTSSTHAWSENTYAYNMIPEYDYLLISKMAEYAPDWDVEISQDVQSEFYNVYEVPHSTAVPVMIVKNQ